MVKLSLYVPLKAKAGKEAELEAFLKKGAEMAKDEPGTITWYAIKEDDGKYAIFDTFDDEAGRDAHLNGPIAKALMAKADELLAEEPKIHKIPILASKESASAAKKATA
jgi:quinol monooxygenase YgiN